MIEFLKQQGVYELVWFLGGILAYMTLQFVVGVTQAFKVMKSAMYLSLSFLLQVYLDTRQEIQEQKESFKRMNPDYTDYALEKEFDKREKDVDLWRDKAFKELHRLSPAVFSIVRSEINETIEKVKKGGLND
jgi:hypothetical protein